MEQISVSKGEMKRSNKDSENKSGAKEPKRHCNETVYKQRQQNAARQRRFMDRLRTSRNEKELVEHKQKRNQKRKELKQAKKTESTPESRCRNIELQRNYMERRRAPENETQLQQYKERHNESQRDQRKTKKQGVARQSLDMFDEKTVETQYVGCMDNVCHACGALMLKGKKSSPIRDEPSKHGYSLCCAYGAIKLQPIKEPPEQLKKLLMGTGKKYNEF